MLIICFMAVLSLDLLPPSSEDAINYTRRLPQRNYANIRFQNRTSTENANTTTINTTWVPTTTNTPKNDNKKPLIASNKFHPYTNILEMIPAPTNETLRLPNEQTEPTRRQVDGHARIAKNKNATSTSSSTAGRKMRRVAKLEKDLIPKPNTQVLQFYAQPVNTIELEAPSFQTSSHNEISHNVGSEIGVNELYVRPLNVLTPYSHSQVYMAPSSYANTVTPLSSMSYKTIPQEYANNGEVVSKALTYKTVNYNVNHLGLEKPSLKAVPILDSFNVYKRNPKSMTTVPIQPIQTQKFVATIRPITSSASILPPVSVTRVHKYTEDGASVFKLPFLDNDDPIDENLPILSAALDNRFNDRIASMNVRSYMTPPIMSKPILYSTNSHSSASLPVTYGNEFKIINKFNEDLRTQTGYHLPTLNFHHHSGRPYSGEIKDDPANHKENYSEDDVTKALQYLKHLKRNKSHRFKGGERSRKRKRKKQSREEKLEDDFGDDDIEPEQITLGSKKQTTQEEFTNEDDADEIENDESSFQIKTFSEDSDRNQEESQKKTVLTEAVEGLRSLETQVSPDMTNERVNEQDPVDPIDPIEYANQEENENNEGERVEFQMHGLGGADSYKFGYDTGKGENRQFRYEERDAGGKVKGHFGYYDRDGKLQLFNYEADPEHGYHLEKAMEH